MWLKSVKVVSTPHILAVGHILWLPGAIFKYFIPRWSIVQIESWVLIEFSESAPEARELVVRIEPDRRRYSKWIFERKRIERSVWWFYAHFASHAWMQTLLLGWRWLIKVCAMREQPIFLVAKGNWHPNLLHLRPSRWREHLKLSIACHAPCARPLKRHKFWKRIPSEAWITIYQRKWSDGWRLTIQIQLRLWALSTQNKKKLISSIFSFVLFHPRSEMRLRETFSFCMGC